MVRLELLAANSPSREAMRYYFAEHEVLIAAVQCANQLIFLEGPFRLMIMGLCLEHESSS